MIEVRPGSRSAGDGCPMEMRIGSRGSSPRPDLRPSPIRRSSARTRDVSCRMPHPSSARPCPVLTHAAATASSGGSEAGPAPAPTMLMLDGAAAADRRGSRRNKSRRCLFEKISITHLRLWFHSGMRAVLSWRHSLHSACLHRSVQGLEPALAVLSLRLRVFYEKALSVKGQRGGPAGLRPAFLPPGPRSSTASGARAHSPDGGRGVWSEPLAPHSTTPAPCFSCTDPGYSVLAGARSGPLFYPHSPEAPCMGCWCKLVSDDLTRCCQLCGDLNFGPRRGSQSSAARYAVRASRHHPTSCASTDGPAHSRLR
jgi:hypothetical protein